MTLSSDPTSASRAPGSRPLDAPPLDAAPATPLPRGFVPLLVLAAVGAGAAQMSAALLTLTLKATELDAAGAATIISLSSGIAGIFTLVALPTVGALSDRSRSRFGRRRPYLVAGAASFALGSTLLVTAPNVPVFVLAHLLITLGFIAAGVTTTALLADRLPAERRGPAAAFLSLSTAMGALLGMAVAQPFGADLRPIVGIPTALAVVAMLALAAVLREQRSTQARTPLRLGEVVGIFWVNPLRFPDFALVFTSRLLVFCGVAALNGFQALYLLQHLHLEPAQLGGAILLTVVVNCGLSLLVAPAIGKLSDRLGVRRPFILVAALVLAAGLVVASVATSFPAYLVGCAVIALGQGVYFAVELALATQVLPDPENPAKDLALIKVADNLPVTLVAAAAPALLAIGDGQNYSALFIAGALCAIVGGLLIQFIRGAR
ncbi:MFS transporter [Paenibacillus sp. TRM 82003]|uniref:MFS transporter n=1 Tax=Kineococcus sp. TRM81007 TaxID=2925831 RepID=UPI001F57C177|nr:MFS transporter [Kineococcus sp. TRM81007]MCI2238747.1 MFS transporter [Kineococcus sp. TRM81007]MCI3924154.1 MFS transporter [Paenibacillus sp. TRM 82003]